MKTLPLSQGKVAIVSDADYRWASRFKWYVLKSKGTFYAVRAERLPDGKRRSVLLHRAIMKRAGHNLTGRVVDHRNHNGLDNRRRNLRAATYSQNNVNQRGPHRDNASGYLGVNRHKHLWRAKISVDGRLVHIGCFATPAQAAIARNNYILSHGLTFHTLNKVAA